MGELYSLISMMSFVLSFLMTSLLPSLLLGWLPVSIPQHTAPQDPLLSQHSVSLLSPYVILSIKARTH